MPQLVFPYGDRQTEQKKLNGLTAHEMCVMADAGERDYSALRQCCSPESEKVEVKTRGWFINNVLNSLFAHIMSIVFTTYPRCCFSSVADSKLSSVVKHTDFIPYCRVIFPPLFTSLRSKRGHCSCIAPLFPRTIANINDRRRLATPVRFRGIFGELN